MEITPLLTIRCFTYNHAPYIRQCLEGFVMQRTTFPFEAIIHDDASTDETAEIVREYANRYPDIIKPIFETENQYSKHDGTIVRIMNKYTKGKYIAYCEGDDYWTDPLKLQKQVDFLESHPQYGIVRTNVSRYFQSADRLEKDYFSSGRCLKMKDTFEDYLIHAWFAAPCTWVYRTEYIYLLPSLQDQKNMFSGDLLLLLTILQHSKMKYLSDTTAVYRVLDKSASHFGSYEKSYRFWQTVKNTRLYFSNSTNVLNRVRLFSNCVVMSLYFCFRINKWSVYREWISLTWRDFRYLVRR